MNQKLLEACKKGDLKQVKHLIKSGVNIHANYDYALRWAASRGNLEVVKCLIEQGADIHAINNASLRWAVHHGRLEIVNYLRKVAGNKWKCFNCISRSTCLNLCKDWNKNE